VTVTDPKVSPISCPKTTLAVNESMTCTGSYTLTLDDILYIGKVDNTAAATGSFTDDKGGTETDTDTDDETITLPLAPWQPLRRSLRPRPPARCTGMGRRRTTPR
jgi:hypothetical protein